MSTPAEPAGSHHEPEDARPPAFVPPPQPTPGAAQPTPAGPTIPGDGDRPADASPSPGGHAQGDGATPGGAAPSPGSFGQVSASYPQPSGAAGGYDQGAGPYSQPAPSFGQVSGQAQPPQYSYGQSGQHPAYPGGQGYPGQPYGQQPPAPDAQPAQPGVRAVEPSSDSAVRATLAAVRGEVAKAVVGQDAAVTGLVIALLCRGHVLLEGVPGVAKTLLTRTLGAALELDMKRVQFTPDLMPGDVTGSLVYDARTAEFSFREGPVFTNLMLADEINRTPPKTQASLLEAMEERQVSVDGEPRPLPDPFMVIATQNPVEYEGTYPLPEAQLERFLLKLILPLPERADEIQVLYRHAHDFDPRDLDAAGVQAVADAEQLAAARAEVAEVEIGPEVLGYIVDICRATRTSPSLSLGVSPRGATALLATCRAWAWLSGRRFVTPDDVKALAHMSLSHRVILRPEAQMDGLDVGQVLDSIIATTEVPR